jgi:hypothetical protein
MSRTTLSLVLTFVTGWTSSCEAPPLQAPQDPASPDEVVSISPDEILPLGSAALCHVLFSCCTAAPDLEAFFAPVARAEEGSVFFDLVDRVPPNAALTETECPALIEEIHTRKGIGPFIAAATEGLVDVNADEVTSCLNELEGATCGAEALSALFDSTCFALQPPAGGDEQRRLFVRRETTGTCRPIADGFGGLFFGTCDPTQAFCCVQDASGACGIPSPDDVGVCAPTAQAGQTCSSFAPVLPCATGLECVVGAGPDGTDGCLEPADERLDLGDACYDGTRFRLLGECDGGWCDILGSDRCEATRATGEACTSTEQCGADVCVDGRCGPEQRCGG